MSHAMTPSANLATCPHPVDPAIMQKKIMPRNAKRCHEYLGDISEVNMFMCNFLILQLGASGIYPL